MTEIRNVAADASRLRLRVLAVGLVLFVMFGNLRGVKESGSVFAAPTYFFVVTMFMTVGVGFIRYLAGGRYELALAIRIRPGALLGLGMALGHLAGHQRSASACMSAPIKPNGTELDSSKRQRTPCTSAWPHNAERTRPAVND